VLGGKRPLFWFFPAVFLVAALYHVAALVMPSLGIGGLNWRHGLFMAIDCAGAYLMLRRPHWFVLAYAILMVQQLWGHGAQLASQWAQTGAIHWPSLFVIIFAPCGLVLLVYDYLERKAP
jgi:hypothetical protein